MGFGQRKSRPGRIVGDGQVHPMQAGDGCGYAQSESGARLAAAFVAANEAPENVMRLNGGHAAPIVVDFDSLSIAATRRLAPEAQVVGGGAARI